ncbi:hypothetical protein G7Y79_00038g075290 [Physcia stellaris]|nr:hypothetical protein G7Y79_00038g075290 [Physcia stellaris]
MSSSAGILSQTLQSITNTKISELRQQRESFATLKSKLLASVDNVAEPEARVRLLLAEIAGCTPESGKNLEDFEDTDLNGSTGNLSLKNIRRFLDQSRYDPSVPQSLVNEWEQELRLLLDQRTRKLDYADLYARLLTEWLADTSAAVTPPPVATGDEKDGSSEEPFELVAQTKLQQLREMFESYVFTPLDTDTAAITAHLDGLFQGEDALKALKSLRGEVKGIGNSLLASSKPFNHDVLKWCIKGLLKNDLLTEHKKTLLEEFLQNEVVLTEIADVLNMRFASLECWTWGEDGIPVEPRKQLNGKYRVMMDEDILQAIFLHYIGLSWSVKMKASLRRVVQNKNVWKKSHVTMTRDERRRREYFLGKGRADPSQGLAEVRQHAYETDYFLAQLPDTVERGALGGYDDHDNDETPANPDLKTPLKIRQQLLHQLASELLIHRALHGEVAVVQSDIQWFYTSLSHTTIFTVLRYFGVPETWMVFFKTYLETPLKMIYEGQESEVRPRKRGVPIAHAISNFMAEAVLFTLDLAVNQEARGTLLYRLTDDIWMWGDPATTNDAWKAIRRTTEVLGLTINAKKSGSVHPGEDVCPDLPKGDVTWGFLKLDPQCGRWLIDRSQVDRHTKQLKRQLNSSKSVFSFIQLWNSCVGRFFKRMFGEPANCFGREHVDMILDLHKHIQESLFGEDASSSKSVTDHLRQLIAEKFGVQDVPDAFLYLPEELGGLSVCNPFISYLLVRDHLTKSPEDRMERFFEQEKEDYKKARDLFNSNGGWVMSSRGVLVPASEIYFASSKADEKFISMTEFTQHRESISGELKNTYEFLCQTPWQHGINTSFEVSAAEMKVVEVRWSRMDSDYRWLLQLHSHELLQRFGGLSIVDKGLLPLGVMKMLRSKKVTWQEVL